MSKREKIREVCAIAAAALALAVILFGVVVLGSAAGRAWLTGL